MSSHSDQLLLHSLFLSLSLLSLLAVSCFSHVEVECLPDQRSLLLSLKDGFSFRYSDDNLLSWTPGSNCCDWDGASCDPSSGHVIGLDLSNRGISGNISFSLFDLKSLQTLNLAEIFFDEPLPQSGFEKLTELTHLNLSGSGVSGQIPIGISRLTRLISLDLSSDISGNGIQLGNPDFQTLVRNLSHLRELHFDGVNISSDIELSKTLSISLPRLHVLTLYYCNVLGILPRNFFLLRNWTTLDLRGNQMFSTGSLRGFPENSHLEVLGLSSTFITGSLFDSIDNLKYLRELRILGEGDELTGTIPASIWNLTRLVLLDLSLSNLTGTIPTSIGNLTQLEYLDLSYNNLIGTIPTSNGNLTQLEYLDLSNNNLIGMIPTSFTQLEHIDLSSNNLIGTIPTSIGYLTQLEYLDLSSNKLSGPIPDSLFSLPVIETLFLRHNQLSSQLNDSLHISTSLAIIDLADNQLQGQIPRSIFKLPALNTLVLRSNNFSGTVELDMFEGLQNLITLDLSNNMLSVQEVSDRYFHSFPKLEDLSLAACNLTKIPTFLRYQDSLQELKLSSNKIHGDIPKWIWTVGNSSLEKLDLSSNSSRMYKA